MSAPSSASMGDSSAKASDSSAAGSSKPKRPLSGYNLFYRYKRLKVLEATKASKAAKADGGDSNSQAEDNDDSELIRRVLTALPGTEQIPSDSPVWKMPQESIDEIRSANIKKEMEGKLLPNENARNRLHRKVHGMGFVEMGKTMRDMWARIDEITKDVFCGLADVGRASYRTMLAEFRANQKVQGKKKLEGEDRNEAAKKAKMKNGNTINLMNNNLHSINNMMSMGSVLHSSLEPISVCSVQTKSPGMSQLASNNTVMAISVPTSTSGESCLGRYRRRVSDNSMGMGFSRRNSNDSVASSIDAMSMASRRPSADMIMSMNQARCPSTDMMSMSMAAQVGMASRRPSQDTMSVGSQSRRPSEDIMSIMSHGRRPSTDSLASLDALNRASTEHQELLDLQQFVLQNAKQNSMMQGDVTHRINNAMQMQVTMLKELHQLQELHKKEHELKELQAQNAARANSMNNPSFIKQSLTQQERMFSGNGDLSRRGSSMSGGGESCLNPMAECTVPTFRSDNCEEETGKMERRDSNVSAQDFMDFIGQLDEAIDHNDDWKRGDREPRNGQDIEPIEQAERVDPSFIFGQPVHDVHDHKGQGLEQTPVPMMTNSAPNNPRARMA